MRGHRPLSALGVLLALAACAPGLEAPPAFEGDMVFSSAAGGGVWQGLPVRQIYGVAAHGPDAAPLTSVAGSGCSAWCTSRGPVWSPDGTRIAFLSDRDGGYEEDDVYLMNADGSGQRRLTLDGDGDLHRDLAWSPDGTRLAYAARSVLPSPVEEGVFDVLVVDVAGGRVTDLTADPRAEDDSPSWSPDGGRIAFVSDRAGSRDIYRMDADGGNVVRLTSGPAQDTHPAWSPDGGRIAFARWEPGVSSIVVMDADGTDPRVLAQESGEASAEGWADRAPVWSPDGRLLAFASGPWRQRDISLVRSDGTGLTDLTDHPADDAVPVWSPDGAQLAFLSDRGGSFDLYAVGLRGGPARRLTWGMGYAFDLDWRRRAPSTSGGPR